MNIILRDSKIETTTVPARINLKCNINETWESGANTITERRTAGEEQRTEEIDELFSGRCLCPGNVMRNGVIQYSTARRPSLSAGNDIISLLRNQLPNRTR